MSADIFFENFEEILMIFSDAPRRCVLLHGISKNLKLHRGYFMVVAIDFQQILTKIVVDGNNNRIGLKLVICRLFIVISLFGIRKIVFC